MPEVLRYRHHEFPPHLNWQALSFMRVEWPFIFTGKDRLRKDTYDAAASPVHFAVCEGEVLISYAALIRTRLEHAGVTYKAYGLDNVFTFPSFRGEGHASRVVSAATEHALKSGEADVAALFCEPGLREFYLGTGWEPMEGAPTLTGAKNLPQVCEALRMMLFISETGEAGREAFGGMPLYVEHLW